MRPTSACFQLFSEKFRLFNGLFGSSDEVLGALESGVDIERRIAQVYQTCRTTAEISAAFDKLQADLDEEIQARMANTRQALLEHFDEEVASRLRVHRDKTLESLSQRERWLWELTRTELNGQARFDPGQPRFLYVGPEFHKGHYHFDWREAERLGDTFYRQDHPLAARLIERAIARTLPVARLELDYLAHGSIISILKPLLGKSGWLELSKLTVEALDVEEFLLWSACTDNGQPLDEETASRLMSLPAKVVDAAGATVDLAPIRELHVQARVAEVEQRNAQFFDEEVIKLDRWSDDLKQGLEREIKELDKEIRKARVGWRRWPRRWPKSWKPRKKLKLWKRPAIGNGGSLYEAQDKIDVQRDELIGKIEGQLRQRKTVLPLYTVRWKLN